MKFILAILSILYLTVSSGVTVNLHYCMDKYVGWDVQSSNNNTCNSCGMLKAVTAKKGCCKKEHKQLKVLNDQKVTEAAVNLMCLSSLATAVPFNTYSYASGFSVIHNFPVSHAPPGMYGNDLYLLNRVFRI